MATAFAAVVTATVALLMDLVGKIGGTPDFSKYRPGGVGVGAWLTALITFVVIAAVVYFAIVIPYQKARAYMDRNKPAEEAAPLSEDTQLLTEIRDLLAQRSGSGGTF
jgi:large conductance mechanosensitive channel